MDQVTKAVALHGTFCSKTGSVSDSAWERLRYRFQYFVTQTQFIEKPIALRRLEYTITFASLAIAVYLSLKG